MWSLIERGKKIIFAVVLGIIPLGLLYVQSKDEQLRSILAWPVTELSGTIENGALYISSQVSDALFRYFKVSGRSKELIKLRREVLETKALRARVQALESENAALLELSFDRQELLARESKVARVIARAGDPMSRMIRIDRGSSHGITAKSPVIAHEGTVGQVLTVAPHFSDVLLLTDASFAIDARIVESGARGLLRGNTAGKEYSMEIKDVDGLAQVSVGDNVVTSGENSNFPRGIPIGQITHTFSSPDNLFVTAKITPFIRVDQLSYVVVLTDGPSSRSRVEYSTAVWPMATQ